MRDLRVGAARFEHRDADKAFNLSRIRELYGRLVEPRESVTRPGWRRAFDADAESAGPG
jgi:hypothetical protein